MHIPDLVVVQLLKSALYNEVRLEKISIMLHILADKYCREILANSIEKPKSAMEISAETRIPLCTVYRRLQILQDSKLVEVSGAINNGKRCFLYESKIKSIDVAFDTQLTVQMTFK